MKKEIYDTIEKVYALYHTDKELWHMVKFIKDDKNRMLLLNGKLIDIEILKKVAQL